MKINHHSFIIPGLVDEAVVKAQAERRYAKEGEITKIHYHQEDRDCNSRCYTIPREDA